MSDDLVERLREYAQVAHMAAAWGFAGEGYTMEKAADRIEELEREVESLKKDLRGSALDYLAADGQAADAYNEQLKLEQELKFQVSRNEYFQALAEAFEGGHLLPIVESVFPDKEAQDG